MIPGQPLKNVWIASSHKFAKAGFKMPGKLRQTNKSLGSYGCVILWKNYLGRQVHRKRNGKIWFDVHALPWQQSQQLQWDILRRQNILVVIGNEVKFQKKIYCAVYYQIFYENKHVGLPFLVSLKIRAVLKFVDTYPYVANKHYLFILIWDLAAVFGHTAGFGFIF